MHPSRCCVVYLVLLVLNCLIFLFPIGPVARWMAVKASVGNKITDNVGPLEITAGGDPLACYESFKTVRTIEMTADQVHSLTYDRHRFVG